MYLICGLGNPGKEYAATRHNMGFLTIDVLAEKLGISVTKLKFKALVGEGHLGGEKLVLLKPQTFMNLSGESIREAVAFYKVPPENIIVIYDDIDLPLGALRIRKGGSSGSHNGMKSVIYQLGFDDFPRIRVGLGSQGQIPLIDFVIGRFTEAERPYLADAVSDAAAACISIVEEGMDIAMQKYNRKAPKEKTDDK